jgi:hypothetical protein
MFHWISQGRADRPIYKKVESTHGVRHEISGFVRWNLGEQITVETAGSRPMKGKSRKKKDHYSPGYMVFLFYHLQLITSSTS